MCKRILVVDDEDLTRDLLRLMLQPAGYEVFEAWDGQDALTKIRTCQPDIVLLDVMMPQMDGITACRQIRADKDLAALPVIMLSARSHAQAVAAGLSAGANRYLGKPISRAALLDMVQELLASTAPS